MYLVVLKSPRARFPYLVGNFPKKCEAQTAKTSLENKGLRKGEVVEVVSVLASHKRHAEANGNALDPDRQRKACARWLKSYFARRKGPMPSETVRAAATEKGFSDWTLRHAGSLLGVRRLRRDNRWWIELDQPVANSAD